MDGVVVAEDGEVVVVIGNGPAGGQGFGVGGVRVVGGKGDAEVTVILGGGVAADADGHGDGAVHLGGGRNGQGGVELYLAERVGDGGGGAVGVELDCSDMEGEAAAGNDAGDGQRGRGIQKGGGAGRLLHLAAGGGGGVFGEADVAVVGGDGDVEGGVGAVESPAEGRVLDLGGVRVVEGDGDAGGLGVFDVGIIDNLNGNDGVGGLGAGGEGYCAVLLGDAGDAALQADFGGGGVGIVRVGKGDIEGDAFGGGGAGDVEGQVVGIALVGGGEGDGVGETEGLGFDDGEGVGGIRADVAPGVGEGVGFLQFESDGFVHIVGIGADRDADVAFDEAGGDVVGVVGIVDFGGVAGGHGHAHGQAGGGGTGEGESDVGMAVGFEGAAGGGFETDAVVVVDDGEGVGGLCAQAPGVGQGVGGVFGDVEDDGFVRVGFVDDIFVDGEADGGTVAGLDGDDAVFVGIGDGIVGAEGGRGSDIGCHLEFQLFGGNRGFGGQGEGNGGGCVALVGIVGGGGDGGGKGNGAVVGGDGETVGFIVRDAPPHQPLGKEGVVADFKQGEGDGLLAFGDVVGLDVNGERALMLGGGGGHQLDDVAGGDVGDIVAVGLGIPDAHADIDAGLQEQAARVGLHGDVEDIGVGAVRLNLLGRGGGAEGEGAAGQVAAVDADGGGGFRAIAAIGRDQRRRADAPVEGEAGGGGDAHGDGLGLLADIVIDDGEGNEGADGVGIGRIRRRVGGAGGDGENAGGSIPIVVVRVVMNGDIGITVAVCLGDGDHKGQAANRGGGAQSHVEVDGFAFVGGKAGGGELQGADGIGFIVGNGEGDLIDAEAPAGGQVGAGGNRENEGDIVIGAAVAVVDQGGLQGEGVGEGDGARQAGDDGFVGDRRVVDARLHIQSERRGQGLIGGDRQGDLPVAFVEVQVGNRETDCVVAGRDGEGVGVGGGGDGPAGGQAVGSQGEGDGLVGFGKGVVGDGDVERLLPFAGTEINALQRGGGRIGEGGAVEDGDVVGSHIGAGELQVDADAAGGGIGAEGDVGLVAGGAFGGGTARGGGEENGVGGGRAVVGGNGDDVSVGGADLPIVGQGAALGKQAQGDGFGILGQGVIDDGDRNDGGIGHGAGGDGDGGSQAVAEGNVGAGDSGEGVDNLQGQNGIGGQVVGMGEGDVGGVAFAVGGSGLGEGNGAVVGGNGDGVAVGADIPARAGGDGGIGEVGGVRREFEDDGLVRLGLVVGVDGDGDGLDGFFAGVPSEGGGGDAEIRVAALMAGGGGGIDADGEGGGAGHGGARDDKDGDRVGGGVLGGFVGQAAGEADVEVVVVDGDDDRVAEFAPFRRHGAGEGEFDLLDAFRLVVVKGDEADDLLVGVGETDLLAGGVDQFVGVDDIIAFAADDGGAGHGDGEAGGGGRVGEVDGELDVAAFGYSVGRAGGGGQGDDVVVGGDGHIMGGAAADAAPGGRRGAGEGEADDLVGFGGEVVGDGESGGGGLGAGGETDGLAVRIRDVGEVGGGGGGRRYGQVKTGGGRRVGEGHRQFDVLAFPFADIETGGEVGGVVVGVDGEGLGGLEDIFGRQGGVGGEGEAENLVDLGGVVVFEGDGEIFGDGRVVGGEGDGVVGDGEIGDGIDGVGETAVGSHFHGGHGEGDGGSMGGQDAHRDVVGGVGAGRLVGAGDRIHEAGILVVVDDVDGEAGQGAQAAPALRIDAGGIDQFEGDAVVGIVAVVLGADIGKGHGFGAGRNGEAVVGGVPIVGDIAGGGSDIGGGEGEFGRVAVGNGELDFAGGRVGDVDGQDAGVAFVNVDAGVAVDRGEGDGVVVGLDGDGMGVGGDGPVGTGEGAGAGDEVDGDGLGGFGNGVGGNGDGDGLGGAAVGIDEGQAGSGDCVVGVFRGGAEQVDVEDGIERHGGAAAAQRLGGGDLQLHGDRIIAVCRLDDIGGGGADEADDVGGEGIIVEDAQDMAGVAETIAGGQGVGAVGQAQGEAHIVVGNREGVVDEGEVQLRVAAQLDGVGGEGNQPADVAAAGGGEIQGDFRRQRGVGDYRQAAGAVSLQNGGRSQGEADRLVVGGNGEVVGGLERVGVGQGRGRIRRKGDAEGLVFFGRRVVLDGDGEILLGGGGAVGEKHQRRREGDVIVGIDCLGEGAADGLAHGGDLEGERGGGGGDDAGGDVVGDVAGAVVRLGDVGAGRIAKAGDEGFVVIDDGEGSGGNAVVRAQAGIVAPIVGVDMAALGGVDAEFDDDIRLGVGVVGGGEGDAGGGLVGGDGDALGAAFPGRAGEGDIKRVGRYDGTGSVAGDVGCGAVLDTFGAVGAFGEKLQRLGVGIGEGDGEGGCGALVDGGGVEGDGDGVVAGEDGGGMRGVGKGPFALEGGEVGGGGALVEFQGDVFGGFGGGVVGDAQGGRTGAGREEIETAAAEGVIGGLGGGVIGDDADAEGNGCSLGGEGGGADLVQRRDPNEGGAGVFAMGGGGRGKAEGEIAGGDGHGVLGLAAESPAGGKVGWAGEGENKSFGGLGVGVVGEGDVEGAGAGVFVDGDGGRHGGIVAGDGAGGGGAVVGVDGDGEGGVLGGGGDEGGRVGGGDGDGVGGGGVLLDLGHGEGELNAGRLVAGRDGDGAAGDGAKGAPGAGHAAGEGEGEGLLAFLIFVVGDGEGDGFGCGGLAGGEIDGLGIRVGDVVEVGAAIGSGSDGEGEAAFGGGGGEGNGEGHGAAFGDSGVVGGEGDAVVVGGNGHRIAGVGQDAPVGGQVAVRIADFDGDGLVGFGVAVGIDGDGDGAGAVGMEQEGAALPLAGGGEGIVGGGGGGLGGDDRDGENGVLGGRIGGAVDIGLDGEDAGVAGAVGRLVGGGNIGGGEAQDEVVVVDGNGDGVGIDADFPAVGESVAFGEFDDDGLIDLGDVVGVDGDGDVVGLEGADLVEGDFGRGDGVIGRGALTGGGGGGFDADSDDGSAGHRDAGTDLQGGKGCAAGIRLACLGLGAGGGDEADGGGFVVGDGEGVGVGGEGPSGGEGLDFAGGGVVGGQGDGDGGVGAAVDIVVEGDGQGGGVGDVDAAGQAGDGGVAGAGDIEGGGAGQGRIGSDADDMGAGVLVNEDEVSGLLEPDFVVVGGNGEGVGGVHVLAADSPVAVAGVGEGDLVGAVGLDGGVVGDGDRQLGGGVRSDGEGSVKGDVVAAVGGDGAIGAAVGESLDGGDIQSEGGAGGGREGEGDVVGGGAGAVRQFLHRSGGGIGSKADGFVLVFDGEGDAVRRQAPAGGEGIELGLVGGGGRVVGDIGDGGEGENGRGIVGDHIIVADGDGNFDAGGGGVQGEDIAGADGAGLAEGDQGVVGSQLQFGAAPIGREGLVDCEGHDGVAVVFVIAGGGVGGEADGVVAGANGEGVGHGDRMQTPAGGPGGGLGAEEGDGHLFVEFGVAVVGDVQGDVLAVVIGLGEGDGIGGEGGIGGMFGGDAGADLDLLAGLEQAATGQHHRQVDAGIALAGLGGSGGGKADVGVVVADGKGDGRRRQAPTGGEGIELGFVIGGGRVVGDGGEGENNRSIGGDGIIVADGDGNFDAGGAAVQGEDIAGADRSGLAEGNQGIVGSQLQFGAAPSRREGMVDGEGENGVAVVLIVGGGVGGGEADGVVAGLDGEGMGHGIRVQTPAGGPGGGIGAEEGDGHLLVQFRVAVVGDVQSDVLTAFGGIREGDGGGGEGNIGGMFEGDAGVDINLLAGLQQSSVGQHDRQVDAGIALGGLGGDGGGKADVNVVADGDGAGGGGFIDNPGIGHRRGGNVDQGEGHIGVGRVVDHAVVDDGHFQIGAGGAGGDGEGRDHLHPFGVAGSDGKGQAAARRSFGESDGNGMARAFQGGEGSGGVGKADGGIGGVGGGGFVDVDDVGGAAFDIAGGVVFGVAGGGQAPADGQSAAGGDAHRGVGVALGEKVAGASVLVFVQDEARGDILAGSIIPLTGIDAQEGAEGGGGAGAIGEVKVEIHHVGRRNGGAFAVHPADGDAADGVGGTGVGTGSFGAGDDADDIAVARNGEGVGFTGFGNAPAGRQPVVGQGIVGAGDGNGDGLFLLAHIVGDDVHRNHHGGVGGVGGGGRVGRNGEGG